jgi:hypothetical protein
MRLGSALVSQGVTTADLDPAHSAAARHAHAAIAETTPRAPRRTRRFTEAAHDYQRPRKMVVGYSMLLLQTAGVLGP